MQAHSREYHGPINTEQVMLIRCAVGHIPSIRKMGEITTPIATIIARNTMRNVFILCFSIFKSSCFSGISVTGQECMLFRKATVIPCSVEVPLLPLTPKTRIPIAYMILPEKSSGISLSCQTLRRSPSCPLFRRSSHKKVKAHLHG